MTRSLIALPARWALVLALLVSVGFSSAGAAVETDEILSGPDVIRLAKPEWVPEFCSVEYLHVQGTDEGKDARGEPVCSYGFDLSERFDESKPQFISVSALNPKTCDFEIEIAELDRPFDPSVIGLAFEDADLPDDKQTGESRRGFAHPGTIAHELDPDAAPLLSSSDRKFTLLGWWVDPQPVPNLRVNAVSVALRAIITDDEVVDAKCKFGYDWIDELPSSWERITTGQWDDQECRDPGHTRAVGIANAAYKSDHFCATIDTWVYYEKMRVTLWSDRNGDDWHNHGIHDTWATGLCGDINLIRFNGFATYPSEYWKITHTE